jgi:hypothetical protein
MSAELKPVDIKLENQVVQGALALPENKSYKISSQAIDKLQRILQAKDIFLNDVELESFGKYILTIGLEIVKYKKNRAKI